MDSQGSVMMNGKYVEPLGLGPVLYWSIIYSQLLFAHR